MMSPARLSLAVLAGAVLTTAAAAQYPGSNLKTQNKRLPDPVVCEFDPLRQLKDEPRLEAQDSLRRLPKRSKVTLGFPAPPAQTADLLLSLLVRCGAPISKNEGGVLEALYPREEGLASEYEILFHGYVSPQGDSSTVTLSAEETSYSGLAANPIISRSMVSSKSRGRAGRVWRMMAALEEALASDSLRASAAPAPTVAATDGAPGFVGVLSSKVFMLPSCSLLTDVAGADRVVFSTEAEAKAAGFLRSGAAGC